MLASHKEVRSSRWALTEKPPEPKELNQVSNFYSKYIARYAMDPMRFCTEALNFNPTFQQSQLIENIVDNTRLAVRSGHGTGKTKTTSSLILWFITTRPFSRVLATAPNIQILNKVLWPELAAGFYDLAEKYPPIGKLFGMTRTTFFNIEHQTRWFAVSRTAAKNNSQGLAGQHNKFLLCIVEEASAVEDEVFEVLDGALTGGPENRLVMVGNPTNSHGRFYDAFHAKSDSHKLFHWDGEKSPLVSDDMIKLFKEEYGDGSREYFVRVRGEFPPRVSGMLLARGELESLTTNEFEFDTPPMRIISVDVAGSGRDSSVILIAEATGDGTERKLRVQEIREYQIGMDTVQLAAEVMFLSKEQPCKIIVDSIGVGQGVSDFLNHNEIEHHALNWGQPSWFSDRFLNQRAEAYHWVREGLARKQLHIEKHPKLFQQMANLPYTYNERGKLQLLSKDRMLAKGIKSPDLADALAQCYLVPYEPQGIQPMRAEGVSHDQEGDDETHVFGAGMPSLPSAEDLPTTSGSSADPFEDFLKTDW